MTSMIKLTSMIKFRDISIIISIWNWHNFDVTFMNKFTYINIIFEDESRRSLSIWNAFVWHESAYSYKIKNINYISCL